MVNLTMENLINNFNSAKESNANYIGVVIKMEGFEKPEIIINERENFDTKLAYYQKAYADDLTLKSFSGIRIVGFTYRESFDEIEKDLIVFNS